MVAARVAFLTRRAMAASAPTVISRGRLRPPTLKYLLILDFEASCGDAVREMEVIEFPTILYDLKDSELDRHALAAWYAHGLRTHFTLARKAKSKRRSMNTSVQSYTRDSRRSAPS